MNKYSVEKLPLDILEETAMKHRHLRKQLGFTQAELAKRSGVSLGSLKRFEQTGQISFASLLRLAQILGRLSDFSAIFHQKEDMSRIEKLFSDEMNRK
jgi:transcriptional regulator with XRE-family HTH domain